MKHYLLNEETLVLELGTMPSAELSHAVQTLFAKVDSKSLPGVLEYWPTYGSLGIHFDPEIVTSEVLLNEVMYASSESSSKDAEPQQVTIPVSYYNESHEDMQTLSSDLGLSPDEISKVHSEGTYQVAMLGFLPGFPYLLGLPPILHHPRKRQPSLRIPAGSVAIGGVQTGIYPHAGPGGWYVIGQTTVNLFTPPDRFLLKPGDRVIFQAI